MFQRESTSDVVHKGLRFALIVSVFLLLPVSLKAHSLMPTPDPTPTATPTPDPGAISVHKYIHTYVSVMDPNIVEDIFGKRISDRFVAIQVTITNKNSDFQFLIHDVSLDLRKVFARRIAERLEADGNPRFELSSLELSMIRGVAEKGQAQDKRNKVLRYLEGAGTVAASFIGFAGVGPKFSDFMALYNGDFLAAYRHVYPDFTTNQMNRLSDSAYKSNTLIPKEQAKVIVAFIPQAMFLKPLQRKAFRQDPTSLYPDLYNGTEGADSIDFRRTEALVSGSFIVELKNLPLMVTGVQIEPSQALEFLKPNPVVKGYILGQFLEAANISLVNPPAGMQIAPDTTATPEEGKLFFVITANGSVPTTTPLTFRVFNQQNAETISQAVSYTTPVPRLTAPTPALGAAPGTAGVKISIPGSGLIPTVSTLVADQSIIHVVSEGVSTDGKSFNATIDVDAAATAGAIFKLKVKNGTALPSNGIDFTIR